MVSTNINIRSCPVRDGYVTLNEALNDYPKLTVVEFANNDPSLTTGSIFSYFGLTFILEGISVDSCPVENFQKQITYTYVHKSKVIFEYPIRVYDFVQAYKNEAIKKTDSSYFFSIGTLIKWGSRKTGGKVSGPAFTVELPKTPGPEDTTTIKEHMDEYMQRKGLVYQFSGAGASAVKIGTGGAVNSSVVSNYTIAKNAVPTYRRTILSWNKKDVYEEGEALLKKKYRRLDTKEYLLYEGDYKPHLPPGEDETESVQPRDLSIIKDNSGLTKSCKITKFKWGQPQFEINATFGYAHCALELVDDPEKPNQTTEAVLAALSGEVVEAGNAYQEVLTAIKNGKYGYPDDIAWAREPVWRLVSLKETDFIYQPLILNMSPMLKQEDGRLEPVTVPTEYQKYLNSNLEVLVKEQTKGWGLNRFAQEDPAEWTKGSIASWLSFNTLVNLKDDLEGDTVDSKQLYNWMLYSAKINLEQYLFRKIPLWEEVNYAIVPYTKYYKDLDEVDWQVQYIPKNVLTGKDDADDTLMPVLFPDPNWTPDLMLISRSRYKSAFGVSGNPEYNPFTRNYYGSNPITLTTGEEEYELTRYNIMPSKNTKEEITRLHEGYSNLEDVMEAIEAGVLLPGTLFNDAHDYMTVSDYGIKGVALPELKPGKVKAPPPSKNKLLEDQYTTLTSLRVAQDQSFKSFVTTQSYSISEGRPPKATLRKPMYEEVKEEEDSPYKNSLTYITSSISNGGIDIIPSVNIASANNIQEALEGAKNQLMMSILTSGSTASAQLLWTSIGRSLVNGKVALPGGNWIIKSCTQTVQSSDGVTFAQPIQIDAGTYIVPTLYKETVQLANENEDQSSAKVLLNAILPFKLGTPLENLPPNFSRWLRADVG